MLKPQVYQSHSSRTLFQLHQPFINGNGSASLPLWSSSSFQKHHKNIQTGFSSTNIKAVTSPTREKSIIVKAVVTVKPTVRGSLSHLGIERGLDDIKDLLGKTLLLELVSAELDPKTGLEKDTVQGFTHRASRGDEGVKYETSFEVPNDFGEVGAVLVENEHHKEMFLEDIVIDGFPYGPVNLYLPSQTASGLRRLREEDLENLRGNGQEERKSFERIYDYDVYNDIGDVDKSPGLKRPVLGGKEHPYPRRCRTGRPLCETDKPLIRSGIQERNIWYQRRSDPLWDGLADLEKTLKVFQDVMTAGLNELRDSLRKEGNNVLQINRHHSVSGHLQSSDQQIGKEDESSASSRRPASNEQLDPLSEKRSKRFYVPRDECFSEMKGLTFSAKALYLVLRILVPRLGRVMVDADLGFPYFKAIDSLFSEGVDLPSEEKQEGFLNAVMPRLVKTVSKTRGDMLRFESPETMKRDNFFWFRDDEFAQQTLAGVNPNSIKLVTEWPLKSKLDPDIYGPQESVITTEMIEEEIGGLMTVDKAIKQKKLFILDYHDLLLPFVNKVRQLEGTTLYGSRTLFFLTKDGTLRPLAIELTRPPMEGKPLWRQVFTPSWHSTGIWLWRIAKAHVLAHDSGYHQLVSHWLTTHCVTEPYVIATNRQLSVMHPIYRLLHPHFRYTIEINALAREGLINAGGTIESAYSPGKYCMELCSVAYDLLWRFDHQALPVDLLSRGMAVEDPSAPHGLKLTIKDYPFANDGLILWDAIKLWVTDYVNHYYPNPSLVETDQELQTWWTEIRTVGHADKKDEPWWPVLKAPKDLIDIITTITWVTSGHHAAVNFGQYSYAGYFPNRPTIARINMPTEDPNEEEWQKFMKKPEGALLQCFPSQLQATVVMSVLNILSNHSPDEEYLGETMEPAWAEDPWIKTAFERFKERLKELEIIIDERNADNDLKNRVGAGTVPYQLLKPVSEPGLTGKGVPYSISI